MSASVLVPLLVGAGLLTLFAVTLRGLRARDEAGLARLERALERSGSGSGSVRRFTRDLVDGLPAPARRFLLRAIAPDTPLACSVRLRMRGGIRLRPGSVPLALEAEEVLGVDGFVWRARAGRGFLRIAGYDRYAAGSGRMRWWLAGLIPVLRADGRDVSRSAAGRAVGEAVLVPSLLVPGAGVRWEAVDERRARFTRTVGGDDITVTLTVDDDGRPTRASLMRWRGDTGAGEPGPMRFDVEFDAETSADGYTIPAHVRAGWRLGSPDEFAFLEADLAQASFH
jgi:hypothetical protein